MKKNIFFFILGAIIFGSIGSVVAYNYNAKDVSYTPSDDSWDVNNVEDALKTLYQNKNKDIIDRLKISVDSIKYSESYGIRDKRSTALDLDKGSYMIYIAISNTGNSDANTQSTAYDNSTNTIIRNQDDNCIRLKGRSTVSAPTAQVGNRYTGLWAHVASYICTFPQTTTVEAYHNVSYATSEGYASNIMMQAIKLD